MSRLFTEFELRTFEMELKKCAEKTMLMRNLCNVEIPEKMRVKTERILQRDRFLFCKSLQQRIELRTVANEAYKTR